MPDRSELNNAAIIVANIRTGRIKLEEVTDPGDRTQLGFLIDLANEDPKFAEMVRRKELEIALKSGKRPIWFHQKPSPESPLPTHLVVANINNILPTNPNYFPPLPLSH